MWEPTHPQGTPHPRIVVRTQTVSPPAAESRTRFIARIVGLQVLKCAGFQGWGATEEEAVLNLRTKILQFLDFDFTGGSPDSESRMVLDRAGRVFDS